MKTARKRMIFDASVWTAGLFMTFVLLTHEAGAESSAFAASHPAWKAECGACHIAYPPQLLPASSWRRIMSGLDKHFGADASLEPQVAADIGAFLEKNAATGKRARGAADSLRITDGAWFLHEHEEVSAAFWKRPEIKTPANCAACHPRAEQGLFNEHEVRIPR